MQEPGHTGRCLPHHTPPSCGGLQIKGRDAKTTKCCLRIGFSGHRVSSGAPINPSQQPSHNAAYRGLRARFANNISTTTGRDNMLEKIKDIGLATVIGASLGVLLVLELSK